MTKVNVNNNMYCYEVGSNYNVQIIGVTVSMWRKILEIVFTSDGVLNIQDSIGKGFGSREINSTW